MFSLRHPWLLLTGFLLCVIAVTAALIFILLGGGGREDYPYPVQTFEDLGRNHIPAGQTFDGYNSNPPTSGPHGPVADWGVQTEPVPKESAVHNMEHGGVVIWYNCAGGPAPLSDEGCQTLQSELGSIVEEAVADDKLVMMTRYADMDQRIALTAWRKLDAFDDFDEAHVRAFIAAFERLFNPENF